jgi:hypothetical protein
MEQAVPVLKGIQDYTFFVEPTVLRRWQLPLEELLILLLLLLGDIVLVRFRDFLDCR